MQANSLEAERMGRILAARIQDIVSEEDMRPFLKTPTEPGCTIEFNRPIIPPATQALPTMFFQLTEQGWERVPGPKPGCMTIVVGWVAGAAMLLYHFLPQLISRSSHSESSNSDTLILIGIICVFVGPIMYWVDYTAYNRSLI